MYHVTRATNIESILKHGIEPRLGERAQAFGEPVAAVYAFQTLTDCEHALMNWFGDWFSDQEEIEGGPIDLVVIAFDPTGLAQLPLEADFEARFTDTVPPTAFRSLHSEEAFTRLADAAFQQQVA